MKTILTSAAAALAMITAAFAAEATGVVASVDPDARTIVLESGETFTVAEEVPLEAIAPGVQVLVAYDEGTTVATEIAPAG